ncbi:MAG: hypothetical protein P1S60_04000 [Anaerolineae bacterium]|nr:hypothetical protein [Anaerolineae bacterium]
MKTREWTFGIANLALKLVGPDNWLSPLASAWAPWHTAAGDSQPWNLVINMDAALAVPEAPLFAVEPHCRGGMCILEAPGYKVQIDAGSIYGEMVAHPEAQVADVGYFLRVAVALCAFTHRAMLFHAACVVHHEKGYLLFGLSGSGKTTASLLSAPDQVLNDDLLLLWPVEGGWDVYGTPFGKRRGSRMVAPLQAALRLVQDTDVYLEPLSKGRALTELVANSPIVSADRVWLPELMERWMQFMDQVPVQALHFKKDPSFWEVIDAQWK